MRCNLKLWCVALVWGVLGVACSKPEYHSVADYYASVEASRIDAVEARESLDARGARKIIKRTQALMEDFEEFVARVEPLTDTDAELQEALYVSSRATFRDANLAVEAAFVDDELTGLKANAYYASRRLALVSMAAGYDVTVASLYAADTLEQLRDKSWIQEQWDAAVDFFTEESAVEEGLPDSDLVVVVEAEPSEVDESLEKPISLEVIQAICKTPARLSMAVAAGFAVSGQSKLALYEIHSPEVLASQELGEQFIAGLLRSFIYSRNNCPHLAVDSLESITTTHMPLEYAQKFIAGMHLQMAGAYIQLAVGHHNGGGSVEFLKDAERHIGLAIRAWPNSPVTQYLTGECLAAGGQYAAAADSLELLVAETEVEWLAEIISERVKQFRDADPSAANQALFSDSAFIKDVLLRYMLEEAEQNENIIEMRKLYEASQIMAEEVLLKLDPRSYFSD